MQNKKLDERIEHKFITFSFMWLIFFSTNSFSDVLYAQDFSWKKNLTTGVTVYLKGAPKVTWAADNITKTTTYTYADKTTYLVTSTVDPTTSISWSSNHLVRTTNLMYANGKKSTIKDTIQPNIVNNYSGNTQITVTTYGDGFASYVNSVAIRNTVSWGGDHITKITTYSYANGGSNTVVDSVQPTISPPVLTAAIYQSNWTSNGLVIKPSVSPVSTTFGDGTTNVNESGTIATPFMQASLYAQSIKDANAVIRSETTDYNLTWGTPDKMGPSYAAAFDPGYYTFSSYFKVMNHQISGQCALGSWVGLCLNGVTIAAPFQEVLEAWNQGWTGKGQNILLIDGYSATNTGYIQGGDAHGVTTMLLANRYAIGANLYGLDFSLNSTNSLQTGTIKNIDGSQASGTSFGVVNTSFGSNYGVLVGHQGGSVTTSDVSRVFSLTQTSTTTWSKLLDGRITYSGFTFTDAVITKSAGNDSITSEKESYVKTYSSNTNIQPRLLVVGALNFAGTVNNRSTIANYSNTAGTDPLVASRFLVASGGDPFPNGALAVDGVSISTVSSEGTSYAAPRVAGYVAIVRSKFPNLDAVKTASIMLDTARYDTLTCYPNCDPAIYGKGEASLSRALAPIGRLR